MMKPSRSCCPIACSLDLLGDKWTLLVVRDLLLGRQQFKEFLASPEKIATNILTDRLQRLIDNGLVIRTQNPEYAKREIYQLTKTGESLGSVIQTLVDWGLKNLPDTKVCLTKK